MKRLLLFPFFFFVFSGCNPVADEIGCQDDMDCRFGRQCVQNICIGDIDLSTTNNVTNNNGNNYNCNEVCDGYYDDSGHTNSEIGSLSIDCNCNNNYNNYTNNNYTNNNYTNNNNYNNYSSNNNTNNYTNNYTGNNNYTNNSTTSYCRYAEDCGPDEACSDGYCFTPSYSELVDSRQDENGCIFVWEIEGFELFTQGVYACRRDGEQGFSCNCFINDPMFSAEFRGNEDACSDERQIEQDFNDYCNMKIRDTF